MTTDEGEVSFAVGCGTFTVFAFAAAVLLGAGLSLGWSIVEGLLP